MNKISNIDLKSKKINRLDVYELIDGARSDVESSVNAVVKDVNKAFSSLPKPYDDSVIAKKIKDIESIKPVIYDDSSITNALKLVKASIHNPYDDEMVLAKIKALESKKAVIYDDKEIKIAIKKLESKKPYDDSSIHNKIKLIEDNIKPEFDDSNIISRINKLIATNESQAKECAEMRVSMLSMQKEIRSNRKESGLKIDIVEQKLNRITEIK